MPQHKLGHSPVAGEDWHPPGYTGYVRGLAETYKKTPVMAQLETRAPEPESFVATRAAPPPKASYAALQRDPVNHPEECKPRHGGGGGGDGSGSLWPCMVQSAVQESFKPPCSNIALGDERISPFKATSYASDFCAPFEEHGRLRSPMRNKDIAATTASLRDLYASSFNRVGDKRLAKMISTMRERLSAKLGNRSDNAFRLRRLFKAYDAQGSGRIHYEDFRNASEGFGMQLDDDSLLALYHRYDPRGSGYLEYEAIVRQLLDADTYALHSPEGVNNTQALLDAQTTASLVAALRARVSGGGAALRRVCAAADAAGGGVLGAKAFAAALASCGVVLSPKEGEWCARVAQHGGGGMVDWAAFCDALEQA